MREIKFRIWDGEDMRVVEKKEYLGFTGLIDPIVGHEDAKWMQYTGLKDKNGVEIYEGDIIHVLPGFNGNDIYAEVYYKRSGFALRRHNELDSSSGYLEMVLPWVVVIGNIHENPELLKGESE